MYSSSNVLCHWCVLIGTLSVTPGTLASAKTPEPPRLHTTNLTPSALCASYWSLPLSSLLLVHFMIYSRLGDCVIARAIIHNVCITSSAIGHSGNGRPALTIQRGAMAKARISACAYMRARMCAYLKRLGSPKKKPAMRRAKAGKQDFQIAQIPYRSNSCRSRFPGTRPSDISARAHKSSAFSHSVICVSASCSDSHCSHKSIASPRIRSALMATVSLMDFIGLPSLFVPTTRPGIRFHLFCCSFPFPFWLQEISHSALGV